MVKILWCAAAVSGALAVAAGAFGAHALRSRLTDEMLGVYEVGARYHFYHALAMLAAAWALDRWSHPAAAWAGWLMLAGTLLFSGSLYMLSLTGIRWLGAVTPLGGVAFIAGWICLAWAAWQS